MPFLKPPGYRDHLEREGMEYEKGDSALEDELASKSDACLRPCIAHSNYGAMIGGSYQPALQPYTHSLPPSHPRLPYNCPAFPFSLAPEPACKPF